MTASLPERLRAILSITFAFFVFTSTFSIALAQLSLGVSLALFAAVIAVRKYNPFRAELRLVYLSIALYVVWLWLVSLLNVNSFDSLKATREEWLFCAVPIGIFVLSYDRARRLFIYAVASGVLLISIYGLFQHFTGIILFKSQVAVPAPDFGYCVSGQFSHRLTFGNFISLMCVFLLTISLGMPRAHRDRFNPLIFLAAVLAFVATLLSYSRGPIVSLVLILLISSLVAGRRIFKIGLPVMIAAALLIFAVQPGFLGGIQTRVNRDLDTEYSGSRFFIWNNSWQIIKSKPIVGVGPANFKESYSELLGSGVASVRHHSHAHNDLLNYAAISGIPGALIWLMMFLTIGVVLYRRGQDSRLPAEHRLLARAALLATGLFLAASMTEAVFADEEVRQALMFIWAAGLAGSTDSGTGNIESG